MRTNKTKENLLAGQPALGAMFNMPEPAVVELCAYAGFDFVFIDTEHGAIGIETLADMIRAAEVHDLDTVVRVPVNAPDAIGRVLDAGARGIIVPGVTTPEDAKRAVRSARYAPVGSRGVGSGRARGYGHLMPVKEYATKANDQILVVALLENVEVVGHLDAVLAVPGIDVFFVGPSDLSQSMGLVGKFDDPHFVDARDTIIRRVLGAGRIMGSRIHSSEDAKEKLAQGFLWLHVSINDVVVNTGRQLIERIRSFV